MRRGIVAVICLVSVLWLACASGAEASAPPANDDFANAETFVVAPSTYVYAENDGATTEPGEPAPQGVPGGASVWFDWTAERSGGAEFSACWGIDGSVVGVYTGEAVASLSPVPRIFGRGACEFGFQAVAGVTYRIQVEGGLDPATGAAATGVAVVSLQRFPFNDDFEAAVDLKSWPSIGWLSDWGNLGATKQPGEPDHDGDPGGSSVWFNWTAPAAGTVKVDACFATFSPLVAVYTGTEVSALTPVAAGADEPGAVCNASTYGLPGALTFQSVAGQRYEIAVDGRGGAEGTFNLIVVMDEETRRMLRGEPRASGPPPPPWNGRITISRDVDSAARTAAFRLSASAPGASFRCRLDHRPSRPCGAKVTYRNLTFGHHTFHASAGASTQQTAATAAFRIARPKVHPRLR